MNRCIPQKGAKTGDGRSAPYSRTDYGNNGYGSNGYGGGGGGGSLGNSGGWIPPGQRLAAAAQEEQKRRYVSAQVLKQPAILVSTKNKGYPDLLLPLNKGNRFRRQVVRRRRLLQYRPLRPLDPADRLDVHFSKTGFQDFFQVTKIPTWD